ncbi:hypothetical protein KP79_PYT05420 [Mizuhopecten yessoensis]|uniref:Uncharacterized protein n=1 Tax=Mizuhopecten yessoensis TaxID=6573 RepID=A0A210PF76_MIZYE|nr:hypothetical protein KP79_PYT05420 [Mizuhopecten yessoensis]
MLSSSYLITRMSSSVNGFMVICVVGVVLCGFSNAKEQDRQYRREQPGLLTHKMIFHPSFTRFNATDQPKQCLDWIGNYEPEFSNTTQDCNMDIDNETLCKFVYEVVKNNYNFVHLYLQFFGNGNATYTKCVIEPQQWVWTYKGPGGALQYLKWPPEYSVWSMGLLAANSHITPYPIDIQVNSLNNCSVFVGKKITTGRVGLALSKLSKALSQHGRMKYESSYFCFKTRTYIENEALYKMCLHMICPLEATGYICCHMEWSYNKNRSVLVCPPEPLTYDEVWWIVPFVLGTILFAYFPIILFMCSADIRDKLVKGVKRRRDEYTPLIGTNDYPDCDWLFTNPISVWAVLTYPLVILGRRFPVSLSRTVRFLAALFSLIFIVLKVVVHYLYQYDFVVASVAQGTPMDFLSVLAGYEESKRNFLSNFGGPYEASCLYLLGMILFMCIPRDLADLLETGIPQSQSDGTSPLTMPRYVQQRLGSVNTHDSVTGYRLMYITMTSNFFMLLNSDFWRYTYQIQSQRFCNLRLSNAIAALIFPLYFALCVCEICACVIYFGLPVTFFSLVFLRSNIFAVWRKLKTLTFCFRFPLLVVIMPLMLGMMLFMIYMFSIIFVGSFIFLSRVAVFTYTGLFAFPNYSYGYIIFGVTILMYMHEIIDNVRDVYSRLFQQVSDLCQIYQTEHEDSPRRIFRVVDRVTYIPLKLFFLIVNRYKPPRVQMVKAFIKIMVLAFVLFLSVYLIHNFQMFKQLSILTQSATTLFVCLLPKLLEAVDCPTDGNVWSLRCGLSG